MLPFIRQSTIRCLIPPLHAAHRLFRHLKPIPAGSFRILLFHDVAGSTLDAFRTLVANLAAKGRLLPPSVADPHPVVSTVTTRHGVVLSFDDGFVSNLAAGQMLQAEFGVPAVFFVCPGLVELSGDAQREAIARRILRGRVSERTIRSEQRLMTWDEVGHLAELGHVIGSHALSHQCLAGLQRESLAEEVAGAAEIFRRRLGWVPEWFAYPFGDAESIDPPALQAISRVHRLCRSGVRGENQPGEGRFLLFAEHVDLDLPLAYQRFVADGGLDIRYRQARRKILEDWRFAQLDAGVA